jgi:hypothetical protein
MDLSNPTSRWKKLRNERPDTHDFLGALAEAEFQAGKTGVEPGAVDTEGLGEAEAEDMVDWRGDENGPISFSSDELRREYLVRHAESLLQGRLNTGPEGFASSFRTVSNRAVQLGGVGENIPEIILLLVAAGRAERILSLFGELAKRAVEEDRESGRSPFWDLYQPLTNVLHRLDVGPEEVAQNAAPILKASSRDMMGGQLHGAVEKMARQSEERAYELYDTLISHPGPPVKSLAADALEGLSAWDFEKAHRRAIRLTEEEIPILKRVGIVSLGKVDFGGRDHSFLRETWERLKKLAREPDEETDYVLVRTLGDLLTAFESTTGTEGGEIPGTNRVGEVLAEMAGRADQRVKHAVAQVLFLRGEDHLHSDWYQRALLQVADVPSTHAQTIRHLDASARRFLDAEHPSPEKALDFLREFVVRRTNGGKPDELLSGMIASLRDNFFGEFRSELTRWLASSEPDLHRMAANMYKHFDQIEAGEDSGRRFHLSKEVLDDLGEQKVVHVVKRACGYVAGGGTLLADLVISALYREPSSDELMSFVGDMLTEHVLYNYPEGGRDVLEDYAEDTEKALIVEVARKALKESARYYEELQDLPHLKEFRPPSRRKYLLRKALHDQQTKIKEQAWEQSDILSLFSHQPLKYGRAFFSDHGPEGFSEPTRLGRFPHSTEMPRGANIDPVGMEYQRFRWRQAGLEGIESELEEQTEDGDPK